MSGSLPVAVTGLGVLSGAGIGAEPLAAALVSGTPVARDVRAMYDEPLPVSHAPAIVDFDIRTQLGRKGTTFLDRGTGLALVAYRDALADARVVVDDGNRHRVGVVVGTTAGSLRSTCDYSRETLVAEKPYLVNPALFPNTVMNCAAGQTAIRFGLRGVNATIAEGPLGFHAASRYAVNALRRGYADVLLVGAVEEFTPHTAWATYVASGGVAVAGEAAVAFALEPAARARAAGRRILAELLAQGFAYRPGASGGAPVHDTFVACVRSVIARAGVRPAEVDTVVTGESGPDDRTETDAVAAALGAPPPRRLLAKPVLGECQAATGGLGLVAAMHVAGTGPLALCTARSRDGGVACALWRLRPDEG
jgi:3-oxoacyl-[acyl-carrier-protein] synthase II